MNPLIALAAADTIWNAFSGSQQARKQNRAFRQYMNELRAEQQDWDTKYGALEESFSRMFQGTETPTQELQRLGAERKIGSGFMAQLAPGIGNELAAGRSMVEQSIASRGLGQSGLGASMMAELAKQGMQMGTQARSESLNKARAQRFQFLQQGGRRPSMAQGYLQKAQFDPTQEVDIFPLLWSMSQGKKS